MLQRLPDVEPGAQFAGRLDAQGERQRDVPDGAGGRRTTLGYTWGLSVRLTDVRMLSRTKNMTLFLTMSKVWVGGSDPEQFGARSFQIAGLSLAPRKK